MVWLLLFYFLILVLIGLTLKYIVLDEPKRESIWLPQEKLYRDPQTNTLIEFPSVSDVPTLELTLVIPAYNEEERIRFMLEDTLNYLNSRQPRVSYELIIVDDGSRDNTSAVAMEFVQREGVEKIRLLKLKKNRGKGGAVRRGMLCGRGKYLLMVDADGATKISDCERLENALKKIETQGLGIAVGSRALAKNQVKKSVFRLFLTWGFHVLVETLCVKGVQDTQCGFKLFTRRTAHDLFRFLHVERWAFDVELLYLAQSMNTPITEVAVTWTEIEGSKVSPFWDSLKMAKDIVLIRLKYLLGVWSMDTSRFLREA